MEVFLQHFQPVTLEELNQKAAMLERSENKYIISVNQLHHLADELKKEFDILEIGEKRIFSYETIYFDDTKHICFVHHKQKKRQRFKVRTRKYIDSNVYFFEVKLKDTRGKTKKFRYKCTSEHHGIMTQEAHSFLKDCFKKLYKRYHIPHLEPILSMSYSRMTLVAKKGQERMTIDFQLTFHKADSTAPHLTSPNDFIIVETKSTNGKGIADKIFRSARIRSTSCSKFCVGTIALGQVRSYNEFRPLIKTYFPHLIAKEKM